MYTYISVDDLADSLIILYAILLQRILEKIINILDIHRINLLQNISQFRKILYFSKWKNSAPAITRAADKGSD